MILFRQNFSPSLISWGGNRCLQNNGYNLDVAIITLTQKKFTTWVTVALVDGTSSCGTWVSLSLEFVEDSMGRRTASPPCGPCNAVWSRSCRKIVSDILGKRISWEGWRPLADQRAAFRMGLSPTQLRGHPTLARWDGDRSQVWRDWRTIVYRGTGRNPLLPELEEGTLCLAR